MTTYDHSEQEQLEQLKDWWKQYGKATIMTIIIAVCAGSGWRYWEHGQEQAREQASQTYELLLMGVDSKNAIEIDQRAHDLIEHHPKSDYAKMAALFLAKQALDKNDRTKASEKLRWVIDSAKISSTRQIARIRLARLLLEDKKPADALTLLEKIDDKAYLPLINATKGDAYLASGKSAEAKQSWEQAIKALPETDKLRPILQMKLDNV